MGFYLLSGPAAVSPRKTLFKIGINSAADYQSIADHDRLVQKRLSFPPSLSDMIG